MDMSLIEKIFVEKNEIYAWIKHGRWFLKIDLYPEEMKGRGNKTTLSFLLKEEQQQYLAKILEKNRDLKLSFFSKKSKLLFQAKCRSNKGETLVVHEIENIEYIEKRSEPRYLAANYSIQIISKDKKRTFKCFDISHSGFSVIMPTTDTSYFQKDEEVGFILLKGRVSQSAGRARCVKVSKIKSTYSDNIQFFGKKVSFALHERLKFDLKSLIANE